MDYNKWITHNRRKYPTQIKLILTSLIKLEELKYISFHDKKLFHVMKTYGDCCLSRRILQYLIFCKDLNNFLGFKRYVDSNLCLSLMYEVLDLDRFFLKNKANTTEGGGGIERAKDILNNPNKASALKLASKNKALHKKGDRLESILGQLDYLSEPKNSEVKPKTKKEINKLLECLYDLIIKHGIEFREVFLKARKKSIQCQNNNISSNETNKIKKETNNNWMETLLLNDFDAVLERYLELEREDDDEENTQRTDSLYSHLGLLEDKQEEDRKYTTKKEKKYKKKKKKTKQKRYDDYIKSIKM